MANRIGIQGRTIDLYIQLYDQAGNPANADETPQVKILDTNGTEKQAYSKVGVSLCDVTGLYKLSYTIPEDVLDGYWTDSWKAVVGGENVTAEFSFLVMSSGAIVESDAEIHYPGDEFTFEFTPEEVYGVNKLLKVLNARLKNTGTKQVPDGAGGYVETQCNVFSNDELIAFLVNSLSSFNQTPHFTDFKFSDAVIYNRFLDVIMQGATLLALAAQALIEKGREFNITDNGITYQPPQISEILNGQFGTELANYTDKLKYIKSSIKPSPRGLGTLRIEGVSPAYRRLRHLRARRLL